MLDILAFVQVLEDKGASLRTLLTVIIDESSTIRFTDRLARNKGFVPSLLLLLLLLKATITVVNFCNLRLLLLPRWPASCLCRLIQLIQVQMKLLIVLGFDNCLLLWQISLKHCRSIDLLVSAPSVGSLV